VVSYPSEKYEFVSWDYSSQLNGKIIHSCSKSPSKSTVIPTKPTKIYGYNPSNPEVTTEKRYHRKTLSFGGLQSPKICDASEIDSG